MKPNLFKITMSPTVSLKEKETLEMILDLFDKNEKLTPDKWGNSERVRIDYNREEIVKNILTSNRSFDDIFIYRNKKTIKYTGWISMSKSNKAFLKFDFDKSMNNKYWVDFFELSDKLAQIFKPRFGVTTIWSDEMELNDYNSEALFRKMLESRSSTPAKFLPEGPLGVGLRTYFNEEIINLFGREFLLKTPAYVEELEWGGIKMDLVKEPWNTEMELIFESWVKVMEYLKEANIFSEYIYRGEDVMAKVITSEKWKVFVKNL